MTKFGRNQYVISLVCKYMFVKRESKMSVLDGLKFVAAKRSTSVSPVVARRNKLLKKLFEQEQLVQAEITGKDFSPTKLKKVTDKDGNSSLVEVRKRVQNWSYTGDDGKLYVVVKYGSKPIEFSKGKQAIEVGDKNKLLKTLSVIKEAVAKGELDAQIEGVLGDIKRIKS